MIRVLSASPLDLDADGLVRPVDGAFKGITPWSVEAGRRAGEAALARLEGLRGLPAGGAVVTPGGGLETDFLIHVVLFTRDEPPTLEGAMRALMNALRRAEEWEMDSMILPPPGLGASGLDPELLAERMGVELGRWIEERAWPRKLWVPVRQGFELEVFRGALA